MSKDVKRRLIISVDVDDDWDMAKVLAVLQTPDIDYVVRDRNLTIEVQGKETDREWFKAKQRAYYYPHWEKVKARQRAGYKPSEGWKVKEKDPEESWGDVSRKVRETMGLKPIKPENDTTPKLSKKEWNKEVSKRTKKAMKTRKDGLKAFTGRIFGWDKDAKGNLTPNWKEQDTIDLMRDYRINQNWSGAAIAKLLNTDGIKGKRGGKWTSAMIIRTTKIDFHGKRSQFTPPKWWGKKAHHDSVTFLIE